jgi:GNAT superfamily N-acetyltransferase
VKVRDIAESDVERVIAIYRAVYGDDFPFREFYDARWVKKGVFDDNVAWVVAEDDEGAVVGSAAVMLNAGDADDLIGEFGRLVVDPACRSRGIGTNLLKARVERVQGYTEWGFAECRSMHAGAQKICEQMGFRTVGFEPNAYKLGSRRESMVLVAQLFGSAAKLRKNNPHVIASVFPMGCQAMENLGLEPDLIVAEDVSAYPVDEEIKIEELRGEQSYRLLRIGRGRTWEREICGGMHLDHGYLKLAAHSAEYLVAKRGEVPIGAVGYVHDPIDDKVRLFELIATDDATKGTLLRRFIEHVVDRYRPVYIGADVSAYFPRMQAALEQLGFFPVAFCPSMVFEGVERLDVVKMAKLTVPWSLGPLALLPGAAVMKNLVQNAFEELNKGQTIADIARSVSIFQYLGDYEIARIQAICRERHYDAGEVLFRAGDPSKDLYIVLAGKVAVVSGVESQHELAEIQAGECFGEMALIDGEPRSATAVCKEACALLIITYGDFHNLMNQQPELGKTVMRNLACTLSRRLRIADSNFEWHVLEAAPKP